MPNRRRLTNVEGHPRHDVLRLNLGKNQSRQNGSLFAEIRECIGKGRCTYEEDREDSVL